MKLTNQMLDLLTHITETTLKTKGKNAGDIKARKMFYDYCYANTIHALARRGLIDVKYNSIYGDGFATTAKGFTLLKSLKA